MRVLKNIHSYDEFRNEKYKINEGLFSFLKGLFKDLKNYAKKVKESGEIDKKIEEWKKELDKIIEEKKADITGNTGKPNEGKKYNFQGYKLIKEEEEKKEEKIEIPEFIKNLGTQKSTGNPIDDAINQFLNNKKAELMPYINSDIRATRLYVYAKLAELNTYLLNKKIEIYKTAKGKEKELKAEQEKLKKMEEESKKINTQLGEEFDQSKEGGVEDIKEGDEVIYKRDKWNEEAENMWKKLSDDDKKNPEKLKPLFDKEYIGKKAIKKLDGENVDFGDGIKKTKDKILIKVEGDNVQGKDQLVNTLKDLKTKNSESIKKINKIADLYKEPDKNKDKIAEIEKQIESEEGE